MYSGWKVQPDKTKLITIRAKPSGNIVDHRLSSSTTCFPDIGAKIHVTLDSSSLSTLKAYKGDNCHDPPNFKSKFSQSRRFRSHLDTSHIHILVTSYVLYNTSSSILTRHTTTMEVAYKQWYATTPVANKNINSTCSVTNNGSNPKSGKSASVASHALVTLLYLNFVKLPLAYNHTFNFFSSK